MREGGVLSASDDQAQRVKACPGIPVAFVVEEKGSALPDVSGKGIAAAFFMAVTRTMLRSTALAGSMLSPSKGSAPRVSAGGMRGRREARTLRSGRREAGCMSEADEVGIAGGAWGRDPAAAT